MHHLVSDLLQDLRHVPSNELLSLPKIEELKVQSPGIQITRFHEFLADGRHLFVIQALKHRFAGLITKIEGVGFVLCLDGSIERPARELLWQFE